MKSTKEVCGVLSMFAEIANHTCQTGLDDLQFVVDFIACHTQQQIAVFNALPDDAASHCVCDVLR